MWYIVVTLFTTLQRGHISSKQCKANIIQNKKRVHNELAAGARTFTIDGFVLKKVKNFGYLGRQISSRDSDTPGLFMNLAKAQKRLSQISNLIVREGVDPAIGGNIYVAVVLAVLLYGSETWVWNSSMLHTLIFYHHTC